MRKEVATVLKHVGIVTLFKDATVYKDCSLRRVAQSYRLDNFFKKLSIISWKF